MPDLLKLLPNLTWRGIEYPVTSRDVTFSHEGARHKIQYREGEAIEQLGAQAITLSYGIPMREDLTLKGNFSQLFSKGLPILFRDFRDRSPSTLIDPVYGEFNCIPTSFRDTTDANKRDGTDLQVEFTVTLTNDELDQAPEVTSLSGVIAEVRGVDADLTLHHDFQQFVASQGTTDFLSAIAGAASQISRQGEKVSAGLTDLASKMDKLDRAVTKAENPQLWGLQQSARTVRDRAIKLAKHGSDPTQSIKNLTLNTSKTLAAVAAESGMLLVDLLKLNPFLAKNPMVPKGAQIKVFG